MSIFRSRKPPKKVQLVLGSGGARGMAHIGVIEELLKDGYEIESVVGCSMGAVIGGMYCAGHLPVYRDWLLSLTKNNIFKLLDFTLSNVGFLKGERVLGKMHDFTGDQLIESMRIPFVAVATNIVTGEEVYFRDGDLYSAMRASISIPGLFTPVINGDRVLVDGGIVNPLPLNLVVKSKDTLVVAVSLNGRENNVLEINHNPKVSSPKYSVVDLLTNSYELTQDRLVELTINHYKPDLVVDIPRTSCTIYDFHKASQMIDLGRQLYRARMDNYKLKLS